MTARLRVWMRAHPAGRDLVIAAVWFVVGLVLWSAGAFKLWAGLALADAAPWVFLLTLGGMLAAVTQRSSHPFIALVAGVAVVGVDLLCGGSLAVVLVFTDLIYAAVRYGSDRGVRIAVRLSAALVVASGIALAVTRPEDPVVVTAALQWVLIVLVSGLWGWNVRSEGERTRAVLGEQHARDTTVLRDRIAHDLHDLVANQIAVAGLHVEAARLQAARLGGDTAPLELSLDRAKQGTDQAHEQLRKLISVLTATGEIEAAGGIEVRAALLRLETLLPAGRALCWEPGTFDVLRSTLESEETPRTLAILRVTEELITNAAKHGAADLLVQAAVRDGVLSLEISNPVRLRAQPTTQSNRLGNGLGIPGAALLLDSIGGELATSEVDGVWIAHLLVPVNVAKAGADPHPATPERSPL